MEGLSSTTSALLAKSGETMISSRLCYIMLAVTSLMILGLGSRSVPKCEQRGRGTFVKVVVCPPGLNEAEWREAGKAACPARGPCNAWIWDDPAKAPKHPPTFAKPMTDAQVKSAVAAWRNNTQTLIVCPTTGC